jgi:hypothetical protein
MTTKQIDRTAGTPRISWFWGILLLLAVVQIGVVLPAAALYLLGDDPRWVPGVMIGGLLIAWTGFIAVLRVGRRRTWWK